MFRASRSTLAGAVDDLNKMKRNITLIAALAVLFGLSGCEKKSKITVYDVLQAHGIIPLIVELPGDLKEDQIVVLEAYGESGLVDSSRVGDQFDSGALLKIFIDKKEEYKISYVSEGRSGTIRDLDFGEATLRMWTGNPHQTVKKINEPLATLSIDGTCHTNPKGDDIAIRVAIER